MNANLAGSRLLVVVAGQKCRKHHLPGDRVLDALDACFELFVI